MRRVVAVFDLCVVLVTGCVKFNGTGGDDPPESGGAGAPGQSGAGGEGGGSAGGAGSGGSGDASAGAAGSASGGAAGGVTTGGGAGTGGAGASGGGGAGGTAAGTAGSAGGGVGPRDGGGVGSDDARNLDAIADRVSRDGGAGTDAGDGSTNCVRAKLLWSEDFETGDYARWTSNTYGNDWGNGCQSSAFSTLHSVSPTRSHRSEIVCAYTAEGNVHRGYGGLQFAGDSVVPVYTNQGVGIDAPFGVVNTFHSWIDTPTVFENYKWFSFWTVNSDCNWADEVLTLGLEDPSHRLAAAHYESGGGTRTFFPNAPGFPFGRWVRITIYVNYASGIMHVWQDGTEVSRVTFVRPKTTMCQWHWGAYASGDNDNLVLFEDDNSIWKLEQPWTDFTIEPWLRGSVQVCGPSAHAVLIDGAW